MSASTYLDCLRPGRWLHIASLVAAAKREAAELTRRWDVPAGVPVPPDLHDTEGRLFRMANGHRITGRLLPSDPQIGFQSAAVPLLFAAVPVLTVLCLLGHSLLGVAGLVLPVLALSVLIGLISSAAGTGSAIMAAVLGVAFPLFGAPTAGMAAGNPAWHAVVVLLNYGVPALVLSAFVVNHPRLRLAAALGAAIYGVGIVVALLPSSFHPVFFALLACTLAPGYAFVVWRSWALAVAQQGIDANLESTGPQASAHIAARMQQAKTAGNDASAFMRLGTAKGVFTAKMDGFAPDASLPFGLTVNDASTHLVCHGATGSGKTSAVLRPLAIAFLRARAGGALILDGKASLAGEFTGMKNYKLIEPGKCDLALLEGLSPEDVVIAFDQVNRAGVKSESGSAQFFRTSGREMLFHAANFLRALVDTEKMKQAESPDYVPQWRWALNDLQAAVELIQRGNDHNRLALEGAMTQVRAMHADAERRGTLNDSLRYIDVSLAAMDSETRANIESTVKGWISPVMHHHALVRWSYCDTGVDVTQCLRGGAVGVCLPEFEYGQAGALIQALVKQRVFIGLRQRARNPVWREQGQTPVLILVDEAQEICGSADLALLPVARSLGGICVYATQQFENWVSKFGDETAARGFLANFRSAVCLTCSPATLKWMQDRLGTTWSLVFQTRAVGIDYRGVWRNIAESPLADASHPAHALYRRLLRRGAGAVRDSRRHAHGLVQHESAKGVDDSLLTIPAMRGGEWKMQPLFLDAEADHLAEPFVAVAEVLRGGVRRRDVIKLSPIFSIPDDLRGVAEEGKPSTEASTAETSQP